MNIKLIKLGSGLLLLSLANFQAVSAPHPSGQDKIISDQQLINQQERQKAMQEALAPPATDIRLQPTIQRSKTLNFPTESPCFAIHTVKLVNREKLPHFMQLLPLSKQAQGQCLGGQGINMLMTAIQNRIISHGYITSRVVAPEQDLTSGTLSLLLIKGTVRNIDYQEGSDTHASLWSSMPSRTGEILNLRDIEQGLENLQRVPTVNAQMELVPGDEIGESDIIITRQQSKFWRVGLSLDDAGTKDTGRYQGSATFYLDNLLGLSDAFYVSGGHDLARNSDFGSRNYLFSYSVPMGYWLLNASRSSNTYHQNVAGTPDYEYSGRSRNMNFSVSRVIHRNDSQKTTINVGLGLRESRNYIDDTEVEVQRRKTTNWTLGINHRHYFNDITLDLGASFKKGVRWFNALKAPEEYAGYGTALSDIFNVNASLNVPFTIKNEQFKYNLDYSGQFTRHGDLTPPDRFSIGGRWTVRGFDGELSLSADQGWYVRNDLAWVTPLRNEGYIALDYGEVSGANSGYLLGHKLAGTAIGLRGNLNLFGSAYYDTFAGVPIYKPKGFKTNAVTLGFSLNWSY